MNKRTMYFIIGGAILLLALIAVAVVPSLMKPPAGPVATAQPTTVTPVTVNCYVGSEKQPLLDDPEIQKLMVQKFQLTVTYKTKGSLDMAFLPNDQLAGVDCLWPSNISASMLFAGAHPDYKGTTVPVLFSPLGIYATIEARDTLVKAGYAEKRGSQYFIIKMNDLVQNAILKSQTWPNLGAPTLKGPVKIQSTDAGRSNSGNLLFNLYANILGGDAYTPVSLDKLDLATLKHLKELQGLQFGGSEDAFNNWYAQNGFGAPLLAGYENQILEKSVVDPQGVQSKYSKGIYLMYPEPSVQAVHVIIPLTPTAQRLIEAMKDPDIQALAWKKHGFRSLTGMPNNPADFKLVSVPDNVVTADLPGIDVIKKIHDCLKDDICH